MANSIHVIDSNITIVLPHSGNSFSCEALLHIVQLYNSLSFCSAGEKRAAQPPVKLSLFIFRRCGLFVATYII
jgi:hypothetical protein